MFGERFPHGARNLSRRLISSLTAGQLQFLARFVAAHRRMSPWGGWKWDTVANPNNPITIFRQEMVAFARQHNLDFFFIYRFQPGVRVRIRLTESVGRNLFVCGCKEPNEFAYLNHILKPGMTFLDLGANIGIHTVWAGRRVGPRGGVIAIEPSTREFARLDENVRLNRLANVHLVNMGASNVRRTAALHLSDEKEPGQNTLGAFIYPGVEEVGVEKAKLETVDQILLSRKIGRVDVVKIDVEGHELFALQGMSRLLEADRPVLLIEISYETLHKQDCTPQEIVDLLAGFDYQAMVFSESTGLPVAGLEWSPQLGNSMVFIPKVLS